MLFRKTIVNTEFKHAFINRFADELNSRFLPEKVCEHIDSLRANISSEINRHYNRWGGSIPYWNDQVANMKTFAENRPSNIKNHIQQEFNLDAYHKLTLQNDDPAKGFVKVNSLTIKENNWSGDYFQGVPIKVTAAPEPGFVFSHWSGDNNSTNAELNINMTDAMTLIPHFEFSATPALPIVINEINYKSNDNFDTGDWVELHNPNAYFIDISGWSIKDNNDGNVFIFPQGTILEGEGYVVLANDLPKFKTFYPTLENVIGEFNFGLSSNGDAVRLFNQNNELQDIVAYLPTAPWPEGANGQGATLELIHPSLDNSLPESWANVHENGSPGAPNFDIIENTENIYLENLNYYPNPFSDQINISFSLKKSASVNIALFNLNGSLMHTIYNGQLVAGQYTINEKAGFLNNGIYLLIIKENNGSAFVSKWIKL